MPNKELFLHHMKQAAAEIAAARAALKVDVHDGDKPPFTLSDQIDNWLIELDYRIACYSRVADLNSLVMEVPV